MVGEAVYGRGRASRVTDGQTNDVVPKMINVLSQGRPEANPCLMCEERM